MRYARSKTPELAVTELDNMRQNVYFIQNNISPKYLAFAVLVKSINGIQYSDLSDDGLQKIVDMLKDLPVKDVAAQMEAVKKKIENELCMYFPKMFEDAAVKEYYDELRARTLLVLDTIINGETDEKNEEIEKITTMLLLYNKPAVFSGYDNLEVKYDKQFENMCLTISQYLHVPEPKKFTVLEYYNAFERISELLKQKKGKA